METRKQIGGWKIKILGAAALLWTVPVFGAIPKSNTSATSGYACEDRIANLYLAGSFLMPGSGSPMNLWIGKPRGVTGEVLGVIGKVGLGGCEAQCKVTRFERFKKDLKPALMELDCEGSRLKTMRMPLHIQWVRGVKGFDTVVRLGSSIYGVEQAALRLQVNRYAIAAK